MRKGRVIGIFQPPQDNCAGKSVIRPFLFSIEDENQKQFGEIPILM
jgi:hypothetical protein